MNKKLRNIFFLIGLIAIVVMCFTFEVSFADLWEYITTAGYWLVAIILLWFLLYMMNAWTWLIILRGSGPTEGVSYWRLLKWTITSFALNNVTPVGLAGGEPYKILELQPYVGTQRATSSVLLFAMMFIFAHFSFWALAIVAYLIMACFGLVPLDAATAILLTFMSLFIGGGIYLFCRGYKNGMVVKMIGLLTHIPGLRGWATRFAKEHEEDLRTIDLQISQLHSQNRRIFWQSYALELIGRMLQPIEILFIIFICSPELTTTLFHLSTLTSNIPDLISVYLNSFLILAFTSLFANMLFFLPLQLGGREGGFAMSVSHLGMTSQLGLFISIITRVRELFWTAIGLLLMKFGNDGRPKSPN